MPPDTSTLLVRILSPKKLVWEGKAVSVSGHNSLGDFSILPQHANFVSLIDKSVTVFQDKQTKQSFPIKHGLIFSRNNAVSVFIDLPLGQARQKLWRQLMRAPDPAA